MKLSVAFLLSLLPTSVRCDCNVPTGLDLLPQGVPDGISQALASGELPYLWIPQASPFIGEIVKFETPIQFRLAQIQGTTVYHAVAKYHPTALDIWGNDEYRICQDDGVTDDYRKLHESIVAAYTFYYSAIKLIPSSEDILKPILEQFGLPAAFLDSPADPSTPWGLANLVVAEISGTVLNDGWNADGKLANDYNNLPYSDFSILGDNGVTYEAYKVQSDDKISGGNLLRNGKTKGWPWQGNLLRNGKTKGWPWQPLIESDGSGYFTKQEHVTPFAGFTGRLYGMTKEHYESFTAPEPDYDYDVATSYVLEQTKTMATSDLQKMLIEYYDSKFTSILPLQINWSIMSGADEFEFWFNDMVLVNTTYDATLLVWKEKVVHNAVRPTTVVHRLFGESIVDTYAGPFLGPQEIEAKDWQPYIRTMPHAEYPSGSACICTAFAETLQLLTGKDDIAMPLVQIFEAGSSKKEKGVTPSANITVEYNKWSEIAQACGESRLYGGMHFEDAVEAGNDLCTEFVNPVVDNAFLLRSGDPAGAFAVLGDDEILVTSR